MRFSKYFSIGSLRTRIALVVIGIGLLTSLSVLFYQEKTLVDSITEAQEENGRNLVNTVTLFIESHYRAINRHKRISLERRKELLHTALGLSKVQVEIAYKKMLAGEATEEEAKREAVEALNQLRYDNSVGYVWINTFERPFSRMIMHPTVPDLDGTILDRPEFNCALGKDENLFNAMVDVCEEQGHGFVDYLWPKPTPQGLSPRVPKLSYVELFEPWGWIIGTGLYIDDIESNATIRISEIVEELRSSFPRVQVAETGYMFLFTGEQEMLIHPNLVGADMSKILNPNTGNPILEDLITTAHSPTRKLIYKWNKPPEFSDDFVFPKMAFVDYFEPLDWYITSTVYFEETELTAKEIRVKVIVLASILSLLGLGVSIWLSSSLTKPLLRLSIAAKNIKSKLGVESGVPVSGTIETRELGEVLNSMLVSLQSEISERKQAEKTLRKALREKEVLLREVHHRVKNNMAVVVSMLNMQAKRVDDDNIISALEESRNRISAMSLIHETLYIADNLAEIPIHDYITNVYRALHQTMMQVPGGVKLELSGDSISLSVEQAVPCGLVLNELITNTFKYGFPDGGPGKITIQTQIINEQWVHLKYMDDGKGLPETFNPDVQKTLGMKIVKLLVENQLNGEFSWESYKGVCFDLRWPLVDTTGH